MTDDDGIIIAGGNSGTEAFSVSGFKILLGSDQDIGTGIQLQVFRCPLLCQMVGDHEQGFATQTQPLAFLCGGDHLEGFASTNHVSEEGISTVKDVCDGIDLMRTEGDLRVHTGEGQVTAIVFSGANGVELFIIQFSQPFTPGGIIPDPIRKCLLDQFLLALSDGGFLLVQNGDSLAAVIFQIVEDANILQVQGFFDNLVGIDSTCAVGVVCLDANPVNRFTLNIPFAGVLRVVNMNVPLHVSWSFQQMEHEVLHHVGGKPCCTQSNGNFAGSQVNRLHCFQGLNMGSKALRVMFCQGLYLCQFLSDIAGEVLIRRQILVPGIPFNHLARIQEDHALQVCIQLFFGLSGKLRHVLHVDSCFFSQ